MEELNISKFGDKVARFRELKPQMQALLAGETNRIANMANFVAALKHSFNWWWIGFYLVEGEELVLGPFQGPIACTRIKYGKGVCGTSWKNRKAIFVPDVNQFPGHIACSSASLAEIVVPVWNSHNQIIAVLDVDSAYANELDEMDLTELEELVKLIK